MVTGTMALSEWAVTFGMGPYQLTNLANQGSAYQLHISP